MTHSYEDIIRLDSERTQGRWEFHDGGRKNDWSESSWVQIPEHFDDNGNDSDDVIYLRLTANAQYIAAMPDAVGLLREYRAMLERAKKWFDMAVTYKMEVAEGGCNQYKIATINGWQAPDLPALITELQRLVGENP